MSGEFAISAARLAGLATRAFGWSPGQFWQATPAELATILTTDLAKADEPLSRHEFDTLLERESND